jgi:hypothetical protein
LFLEMTMQRRFALATLAAALVALTSTELAARDAAPRPERPAFSRNPVATMVDSAQVLGLSAEQVIRLRAIAGELELRNRPTLDSLAVYRPRDGGGGGMGRGEMTPEMRERMEHARPFMQTLRESNRAAMERAMELLTPEQRERAQAMLPRRGPGGRGGPGGPPQP